MYLSHVGLTNFRNYTQLDLDLPPGVVVLFGGNAQGKTSFLEAVYLLAIAKSFRADNEHQVVNWGMEMSGVATLVAGTVDKGGERVRVNVGYLAAPDGSRDTSSLGARRGQSPGVRKQIAVGRLRKTASELVGVVNAVLFTAEDIELVQGPPALRRRYMDILISQVDHLYLKSLQRYQRVLQQRNRLLRLLQERRAEEDELPFWDGELVREGSLIVEARSQALATLATLCLDRHRELTGGIEELCLEYAPNVEYQHAGGGAHDIAQAFAEALEASRRKELAMGSTSVGPHRDDFFMTANGVDMGTYASRGQARTLALTLRLGEAEYLASSRGEGPILLLDDVLSEMDALRRARVLEKAADFQQTIITTTDLEPVHAWFGAGAAYFEVKAGQAARVPVDVLPLRDRGGVGDDASQGTQG